MSGEKGEEGRVEVLKVQKESAGEGEEKALTAVSCLSVSPFECNFCNSDNNGTDPH